MHTRRLTLCGLALLAACDLQAPTPTAPPQTAPAASGAPHPLNAAGLRAGPPPGGAAAVRFSLGPASGPVIISNGTVQLGVNPQGHLNVPGTVPSSGLGSTTAVGLRYLPTGSEATAPGCLCEGWGVADASTGQTGFANVSTDGGVTGLAVLSFTADASEAVSVVRMGNLRVTHHYRPSPATPFLYEATVTIENAGATTVGDLRYTRTMDWDIAPNTFSEFSTIQGAAAAANVLFSSDNGFSSANPLAGRSPLLATGDFVDVGPGDIGAHFDFGFGALAPGEKRVFRIFYGAAGSEADALGALAAVGAEVYSFGQPNYNGSPWTPAPNTSAPPGTFGAATGQPHTFVFAFADVGGIPVNRPPTADAGADRTVECTGHHGTAVMLNGTGSSDPDGTIASYEWLLGGSVVATGPTPTVTLGEGTHTLTLRVTDDKGATGEDAVTVHVRDTTAPTLTASAAPGTLWPPNHKYHRVTVGAAAADACDPTVAVTAVVVSSEADEADGTGDGETTGDIRVTRPDGTVLLSSNASPFVPFNPATDRLEVRAERYGTAAPRVYTLTFTATDGSGNAATSAATVTVAHDQRK